VKDYSGANEFELVNFRDSGLANVAATLLTLLGYEAPEGYSSSILQINKKILSLYRIGNG